MRPRIQPRPPPNPLPAAALQVFVQGLAEGEVGDVVAVVRRRLDPVFPARSPPLPRPTSPTWGRSRPPTPAPYQHSLTPDPLRLSCDDTEQGSDRPDPALHPRSTFVASSTPPPPRTPTRTDSRFTGRRHHTNPGAGSDDRTEPASQVRKLGDKGVVILPQLPRVEHRTLRA